MKVYVTAAVAVMLFLSGCIFIQNVEREGFKEGDLTPPLLYSFYMVEKPIATHLLPIYYKYEARWELSPLYKNYMGAIRLQINNTGNTDIFIYGFAIKIDGVEQSMMLHGGKKIFPGESKIFFLSFRCPGEGNHTYMIGAYAMAGRGGRWYDHGLDYLEGEWNMSVNGYQSGGYKLHKNYYTYFDKINKLVNTNDVEVVEKTKEITEEYGSSYNVGKICAIFDWVYSNIKYVNESDDEWNTPSYALHHGGDCEEFAMLIAAMITAAGGNARVYITHNHAFAAVYIGKDVSILKNVDSYYGANLSYAFFEDEFGYWLVADPLMSPYLGGLPVGGIVKGGSGKYYRWSIMTNDLYSIDVMRD